MRNTILSACLAALALAACDGATRRTPGAHALTVSLPASPPAPALTSITGERPHEGPAHDCSEDVLPDVLDEVPAEDLLPAEPADTLALAHEAHLGPVDHLARARALRAEGDIAGALTEARRAVHDAAEDADATEKALDALIPLARQLGEKRLAADAHGVLAHLFPDGAEPLVQRARLLLELGDTDGAFQAAEAAVDVDPEYPEVYQVLGRAHLAVGELDQAIVRFQQAVHLDPYHGYALNNLGLAWLRSGQDTRAAEALAQAAYLLPHAGFVHNNLGLAYERLGRYPEALMAFETATRLSPDNTRARLNLARLQHEEGAPAEVSARLGGRAGVPGASR